MNEHNLSGKVAVVTGAGKGLGKAMALALGAAGASIALAARNVEQLSDVRQAVENAGGRAEVFQADVLEEDQIRKLERDVTAAFSDVHVLINNAGINLRKQLVDFTLEEWRQVVDTNLTSVFLMCRSFVAPILWTTPFRMSQALSLKCSRTALAASTKGKRRTLI